MYALNLDQDTSRILSACVVLPNGGYAGMPMVDSLPEGNLNEYRYENGGYIRDPLPVSEPSEPAPTAQDDTDAMLIDHEYRLTLLELGVGE